MGVGRFGLLIAVVLTAGLLLGFGVGYPLSKVQLNVDSAVQLDHQALAGTFDPESALVAPGDLPSSYAVTEADLSAFGAIGASYCGTTPVVDGQLGDKLIRSFISSADGSAVISEVVRVRQPTRANEFLRQIDSAFSGCVQKGYFRSTGENRERVKISAGQPRPPVNDYVSYTLRPETTGKFQRLVFFQLGDTVVALQFVGDTLPTRPLLERAQTAILERCAQQQFRSEQAVDGVRPLPADATTTTSPTQPTAAPTQPTAAPTQPTAAPTQPAAAPTTGR